MFDACERVVPPRAAAVPTTPGSFLWCEQSLNLINVIFWNVIHISLIRVLPPSSFTRAFSLATTPLERRNSYQFNKGLARPRLLVLSRYQPTPREKRNSYQCNKRTVPHPRLLVLSPYPPPPPSSENVIHISLIRVLSLSPFTRAFSLPTTPQGKT